MDAATVAEVSTVPTPPPAAFTTAASVASTSTLPVVAPPPAPPSSVGDAAAISTPSVPTEIAVPVELPDPYAPNDLPEYTFVPELTEDENMIVLALIYARLSVSKRGNMGAIIVRPSASTSSASAQPIVIGHSNNHPLPTPLNRNGKHAELHAEARAICVAARNGVSLLGSTIYVSFPPCAACAQLIVGCGITRCVYRRRQLSEESILLAHEAGIELVEFTDNKHDDKLKAVAEKWWNDHGETKDRSRNRRAKWWDEKKAQQKDLKLPGGAWQNLKHARRQPSGKGKTDGKKGNANEEAEQEEDAAVDAEDNAGDEDVEPAAKKIKVE